MEKLDKNDTIVHCFSLKCVFYTQLQFLWCFLLCLKQRQGSLIHPVSLPLGTDKV